MSSASADASDPESAMCSSSTISQDERDSIVEKTQRGKRAKLTGADGHLPAWIGYGEFAKYGYEKRGKRRNTH
jgi:hypothetical protein